MVQDHKSLQTLKTMEVPTDVTETSEFPCNSEETLGVPTNPDEFMEGPTHQEAYATMKEKNETPSNQVIFNRLGN